MAIRIGTRWILRRRWGNPMGPDGKQNFDVCPKRRLYPFHEGTAVLADDIGAEVPKRSAPPADAPWPTACAACGEPCPAAADRFLDATPLYDTPDGSPPYEPFLSDDEIVKYAKWCRSEPADVAKDHAGLLVSHIGGQMRRIRELEAEVERLRASRSPAA